ncbi:hypothetical protein QQG55_39755 [Brugia pahangi]
MLEKRRKVGSSLLFSLINVHSIDLSGAKESVGTTPGRNSTLYDIDEFRNSVYEVLKKNRTYQSSFRIVNIRIDLKGLIEFARDFDTHLDNTTAFRRNSTIHGRKINDHR